ncbi:MAG: hypothetical protein QOK23_567 [Gammaproteobacteria bacterium]|jgi:hypothetical protein|nr:hypothetical protein [Gammaproteobacteria bacterium]
MQTADRASKPWLRRVGWLILIWAGSVAALGLVALVFRLLMAAVGLTRHAT